MFAVVGDRIHRIISTASSPTKIDNPVFQLYYGFTAVGMFVCSVLSTSAEHFGSPIDCMSSSSPAVIPRQALTTFCWIHGTFTLDPDLDSYAAHPGVYKYIPDDENVPRTHHLYYQWVCLVLLAQSISFYIPRYLWRLAENGLTKKLIAGEVQPLARSCFLCSVIFFTVSIASRRCSQNLSRFVNFPVVVNCRYLLSHQNCHGYLAISYHLCETMNMFVLCGNFILTDSLLNHKFRDLGWFVLKGGDLARVFPRMGKCMFQMFGATGEVERHDSLCLLAQNVFNEKIFFVLWFWYIFLGALTLVNMSYSLILYFSLKARMQRISFTCPSLSTSTSRHIDREKRLETVIRELGYGEFFVLRLLSKNLPAQFLPQLMNACYTLIQENSKEFGAREKLRMRTNLYTSRRDDSRYLLETCEASQR